MKLPKLPLDRWVDEAVRWLQEHFAALFDLVSSGIQPLVAFFQSLFTALPPVLTAVLIAALALLASRLSVSLFTLFGLLLIYNLGYWNEAAETISLVLTATTISVVIGVPLGILAAR
ncbi:MAG: glycine/betaine ABC transporter permease, partial [Planifilum fimeticola]